jgi:hypothetical protein
MKKSELKQIIKEEIHKVLNENESLANYTFAELTKIGGKLIHPYRYSKDEVDKAEELYKNIGLLDDNGNMYDLKDLNSSKKTKDGKTLIDLANNFA